MDRRLLAGLAVLGVAIAVGLGIVLSGGGDDDSGGGTGTDTTTALSNDQRPDPETGGNRPGGHDGHGHGPGEHGGGGHRPGGSGASGGGGTGGDGTDSGDGSGQPGGGGGNDPIGDPADVAAVTKTLTAYLQAIAAGDGDGACEQLSASGVETMLGKIAKAAPETQGAGCPEAIVLYQGAYGKTAVNPTFKRIRISGDTATAVGPLREPARLSRSGAIWLIDEYGQ